MDSKQKIVQYLDEARASEHALARTLQSQALMTPRGTYRSALEQHRRETQRHAERLTRRLDELDAGSNVLMSAYAFAGEVVGQALALGKAPLDLVRGTGGEEKVLKAAKDAYATEALEIATYTALERLATQAGDHKTAELAASIREDEEAMLQTVADALPGLADDVLAAATGDGSYDASRTGAADTVRRAGRQAEEATRASADRAKDAAREAHRIPGVAQAEGEVKGAVADASDLPISGYDERTADEITARLPGLSQVDLGKIDAYERRHDGRTTVLSRIDTLRADEPWPGYDGQTVGEISDVLADRDADAARTTRDYERAHKARTGVLDAAERAYSTT